MIGSLTPFIKVEIVDKDITNLVTSFSYEDSVNSDNMLSLSLEGSELFDMYNDGDLNNGQLITFTFGFLQHLQSKTHVGYIFMADKKYVGDTLIINIKASDKGTVTKEAEFTTVWENKTSSEIATSIADKYNLQTNIETTTTKYDAIPQAGRTDFEFLYYLASQESDGNYVFHINGDTLFFGIIGTDKVSSDTYVYAKDDRIISFQSSLTAISQNKEADKVSAVSFDPFSNEAVESIADNTDESRGVSLGEFKTMYSSGSFKSNVGKRIITPEPDKIKVTNITNNLKKKAEFKHLKATMQIHGNPLIEPNSIITMEGKLVNEDLGNWYVDKITHKVTNGYTCTLYITKNATKQEIETADEVSTKLTQNTTVGDYKADDKIVVYSYDKNGELIGGKNSKGDFITIK